jgi:hypothetical protein
MTKYYPILLKFGDRKTMGISILLVLNDISVVRYKIRTCDFDRVVSLQVLRNYFFALSGFFHLSLGKRLKSESVEYNVQPYSIASAAK